MGGFFSKFFSLFEPNVETKLIMVGLDCAGKSTILYKLKLGEIVCKPPISQIVT
jgi:ADP-ribosylation factor 1/2